MKIAVFHNLPLGGAKRVLFEQIKGLSSKHSIDVYEYSSEKRQMWDIDDYANKIFIYDFIKKENENRIISDFRNFFLLDKLNKKIADDINKIKYKVVLVHHDKYTQSPFLLKYLITPSLYYIEEWLRMVHEKELEFDKNIPLINKTYENVIRKIMKNIDRNNASSADFIIANSYFTKNNIKKAYNKKSVVCYPCADTGVFKPLRMKKKEQVIHIGSKDNINGYPLASSAVSLVNKSIKYNLKSVIFSDNINDKTVSEYYCES